MSASRLSRSLRQRTSRPRRPTDSPTPSTANHPHSKTTPSPRTHLRHHQIRHRQHPGNSTTTPPAAALTTRPHRHIPRRRHTIHRRHVQHHRTHTRQRHPTTPQHRHIQLPTARTADPERVSTKRTGDNEPNDEPDANQPTTSTNRFTDPIAGESSAFHNDTFPFAPTFATTKFATGTPPTKFNDDVPGRASPPGHTVTYPDDNASTAVTFNTTAPTPDPGTPPRPNTDTSNSPPATADHGERVSTKRNGDNETGTTNPSRTNRRHRPTNSPTPSTANHPHSKTTPPHPHPTSPPPHSPPAAPPQNSPTTPPAAAHHPATPSHTPTTHPSTAVTFNTTAATPDPGTPPRPNNATSN